MTREAISKGAGLANILPAAYAAKDCYSRATWARLVADCYQEGDYVQRENAEFGWATTQDAIVFAIAGTNPRDLRDVSHDRRHRQKPYSGGGRIHSGFHAHWLLIRDEISSVIDERISGRKCLYFVGHSLGGIVAQIAADYIRQVFGTTTNASVMCWTFGAPRGWDQNGAFHVFERMTCGRGTYLVQASGDPVTLIPSRLTLHTEPYQHAGQKIVIDKRGNPSVEDWLLFQRILAVFFGLLCGVGSAHGMGEYIQRIGKYVEKRRQRAEL